MNDEDPSSDAGQVALPGQDHEEDGGDVVDDGNGEDGVEALVPVGQGQVVADQNLQPIQVRSS